jgi:DNA-binding GntR family transcriptional regulator
VRPPNVAGVINRDLPTPIYIQVARVIAQRIADGDLRLDRPLPSELHLQQEFGVSRDTVRAAIGLLRAWGMVRTVRGKGSYVGPEPDVPDTERPAT